MPPPRATNLPLYGPSNVEANLWIVFHDGIDRLSTVGKRRQAEPFNRNAALLPGAAMPTIAPTGQIALTGRAVSEPKVLRPVTLFQSCPRR
jgi:hypothetical protein